MTKAAAWLAAIAGVLALAFFSATALLQKPAPPPSHARAELAAARELKKCADELRAVLDQLNAAPLPTPLLDDVRAKLRQTQQAILRARLSGPNYDALLATADRVAAYAGSPSNPDLRDAANQAHHDLNARLTAELQRLEQELARTR
jgi:hypothetical protein